MMEHEKNLDRIREYMQEPQQGLLIEETQNDRSHQIAAELLYDGRASIDELADALYIPRPELHVMQTRVTHEMRDLVAEFRGYQRELNNLAPEQRTSERLRNIFLNIVCTLNRLLYFRNAKPQELADLQKNTIDDVTALTSLIQSFYISGSNYELIAHAQGRLERIYAERARAIYDGMLGEECDL